MSLSLLENRRNFIVHCPSNVKLEGSDGHKNTPSHFYVPLPQKIPLEPNEWEVGLSEIFIPSYGYNMKPPLNSSIQVYGKGHTAAGSRKKHRIRIPEGRYYPKVYIRALNEEIEHLEEGVRTRFRFDETSERVRIEVGSGEVVVIDNPRLRKMLGVKRGTTNFSNSRPGGKMTVVMPKRVDFNVNGTSMFVYTNVVELSPVGDSLVPLLRQVHLELDGEMETLHRQYDKVHFFPVRVTTLDMIEIHLSNIYGDDMVFYGGESSAVLHFRRKREK